MTDDARLIWFMVGLYDGQNRVFHKELKEVSPSEAAKKIFMYAERMGFSVARVNIARVERKAVISGVPLYETFNIERSPTSVTTERAICPHCAKPIEDHWRVSRATGVAICSKCTEGRSRRTRKSRYWK